MYVSLAWGQARVQDGVPTSYTDTDFVLLMHEAYSNYSSNMIRVCVASVSAEIIIAV